jgi:hypothetical protein
MTGDMPVRRLIAWIAVGSVAMFGLAVSGKVWEFVVEDSIHGTYYPAVKALDRYCDERGNAPKTLMDLTPNYLGSLPSSGRVTEQIYSSGQPKQAWRLTLVSTSTGRKRLYIADHGMPLSDSERQILVKQYHQTWFVLQP